MYNFLCSGFLFFCFPFLQYKLFLQMAESRQDHTTADPICRDKYVETVSNALVDLIGTKRAQGR